MQSGRLNKRGEFQERVETQSNSGGLSIQYVLWDTLWMSVEPLSGNELFRAQQIDASISTKIVIRYNRFVHPKMRVKYVTSPGSPTEFDLYDINSIIHVMEGNRETQLMCSLISQPGYKSGDTGGG